MSQCSNLASLQLQGKGTLGKFFRQDSVQKLVTLLPALKEKQKYSSSLGYATHMVKISQKFEKDFSHQFPSESEITAYDDSSIDEEEGRCSAIIESEHFGVNETKRVSFSGVKVRFCWIELGDNPAVSSGPPISISWYYFEEYCVSVDFYEANEISCTPLVAISPFERIRLLVEAGYSLAEIRDRTNEVEKIKRRREKSILEKQFASFPKLMKSLSRFSKTNEVEEIKRRREKLISKKQFSPFPTLMKSLSRISNHSVAKCA